MDLSPVIDGFGVVLEPTNLLYCLIGVVIGMLIGVLPGLGPAATIAILLPVTFGIEPVTAIIMLAGIFYGAQYGGTITSVLLRLPGEASSVVTVFDGHELARQGKAGTALGIAAIGSFVGGTVSIIALSLLAPLVAGFALDFGPPEYTALALLGILLVSTVSSGHRIKALVAASVGLLLATVGRDGFTSAERFTFDNLSLADGIDFVPIAMGLFGLGEILYNLEERHRATQAPAKVANAWPSRKDLRQSSGAIGRGSLIGFVLGILPGGGAVLSSLAAYALEKRRAKDPSRFGKGAVEGVAAPETANNAAATSSFIPLLTLGIPANATMAVIFGALLIQGVSPGPQLVSQEPELFWGVVNSMYIGNILLLIMSIPLVGLFVRILRVRATVLAPITVLITLIGVYTVNNDVFDIVLVIVFGAIGYLMKKLGFDPGPLVLAFVLGSLLEDSLRRSLLIFDGDATGFFTRPISGTLLAAFVLVAVLPLVRRALRRREEEHVDSSA
ncbi:tripartite tricarboxylate transporter permease [Actinophytocola algeriensis]|uniref:Putative tricarboxylic transport membrane protein n=1 Tax=Actinophytocola algeriensis TaxID=1768010 RepID=A0A7W7Q1M8_9PSEU|nr:tripartite tricarboxylate transporter permease [Actinophytocola algeriensis]MBB4905357.1 putative tricarboxylic transport membrane protein [Actinophytocola algeriensis]MBE1472958.1 putative tricarboxylic transport membrane protein [Actinophytocola algeriensis]